MIAEFKVSGMHCPSCPKLIAMNVEELEGIEKVSADEKSGVVKVKFDNKKAKMSDIKTKIEQDGYKVIQTKERK